MNKSNIEDIWKEFSGKLRQFIRNKVSDQFYADEILQEVFIKIHSNIDSLKDTDKISGWVFQIARNSIIDYYRKQVRHTSEFNEHTILEENTDENFNKEFERDIIYMMKDVPEIYREALVLTEYEGLTQKELSLRLGISLSGAKSRVQRGRMHLKDLLMQCCHIDFDKYGNIIDYHPHTCCCCVPKQKTQK